MPSCYHRGKNVSEHDMETSENVLAAKIASVLEKEMGQKEREKERMRMAAKSNCAFEAALRFEIRQLKSDLRSGSTTAYDVQLYHRPWLATVHADTFQKGLGRGQRWTWKRRFTKSSPLLPGSNAADLDFCFKQLGELREFETI